jgi:hypothetical protein
MAEMRVDTGGGIWKGMFFYTICDIFYTCRKQNNMKNIGEIK